MTKPDDFRRVIKRGRLRYGKYLALHFLAYDDESIYIGYSVSKKVGKAVTRNKVRRRLKEIVRLFSKDLKAGYYILISAKHSSKEASFADLKEDLFRIMQGSHLIEENNSR